MDVQVIDERLDQSGWRSVRYEAKVYRRDLAKLLLLRDKHQYEATGLIAFVQERKEDGRKLNLVNLTDDDDTYVVLEWWERQPT